MNTFITGFSILCGFYHLIVVGGVLPALGIFLSPVIHRAVSIFMAVVLLFLLFPARQHDKGKMRPGWHDILLIVAGAASLGFVAFFEDLVNEYAMYGTLDLKATILSFMLVVVLLEGVRRASGGLILPILLLLVMLMTKFGNHMPGILHNTGFTFDEIGFTLYIGPDGFFGIPAAVASTIIIMFLIFAQILREIGGSDWFIRIALCIVGTTRGGPAKAAVIASALFGTISGSPASNAAATGSVTIPLMKKSGYTPEFAGAVEATASTGGQILPPVMGAVAFIIAEWLEIRYVDVLLAAAVPAILYFVVVFFVVHIEASKRRLGGLSGHESVPIWVVFKEGWFYILPLAVLIYFLVIRQYPPEISALISILCMVILSIFVDKDKKCLTLPTLKDAAARLRRLVLSMGNGVRLWVRVAIICAGVGIFVGCFTQSGIGLKTASAIIRLSGGHLILLLIFAAIAAYILGMGMDTLPLYITMAILIAPALVQAGITDIGAHLFVLFWGLTSFLTPPVCLAVYVTASIAESHIWKTGLEAMRLGIVLFLVPFAFVYYPSLLLQGSLADIILAIVRTLLATASMIGGTNGYLIREANWFQRIILIAGGFALMMTSVPISLAGLAILAAVAIWQWFSAARADDLLL